MEISKSGSKSSRLWAFQIAVGSFCIILSIVVMFYGASTTAGAYIWLFLAGIGIMILGAERLVSGLRAKGVRRSSRLLNIGVGVGLIIYIGSGFFYPQVATKWLIIFLGFGLLANGIIRIVTGLKKKEGESFDFSSLSTGIVITSLSILVLAYPKLGLALLLVMTAIALAVSGIQIILAGVRGRRKALSQRHGDEALTGSVVEQESSAEGGKGIWKSGSWFRDEEKRYVLFRGVNFGSRSKMPPYLPIAPLDVHDISKLDLKKEIESVKTGLDLLKNLGFNIVRLLISWKAIEPRPNPNLEELLPEGRKYLEYMKEIIDELHARNLYVILDFHQDIANEVYGGDGFPDWAIAIDEEHEKPKPPTKPDKKWQFKYMINKSLKETLKSFWENDLTNLDEGLKNYPVRMHLEKTIGQTVKFFKSLNDGLGHPAILAVEPFNEPHPSTIPKKEFEAKYLMDYYRNVNSEIEKFEKALFIFIEPRVDWIMPTDTGGMPVKYGASPLDVKSSFNMDFIKKVMVDKKLVTKNLETYLPSDLNSISRFGNNGVLSFHYYDTMAVASSFVKIPESLYTYKIEFPMIFSQLSQAATERGLIPFITEFGAFQEAEQIREYLDLQYNQIEAFLLNATIWNYDLYNTEEGKDNWNYENYSLLGPDRKPRNVDAVARPYPMRSSAEPTLIFFDIDSKYASIVLKGKVLTGEPTLIYIPFDIHYSPEFTVWSTSNELKWDRMNNLLYWYPSKDQDYNQLVVGKGKLIKLETELLPEQSKELASKTLFTSTFG